MKKISRKVVRNKKESIQKSLKGRDQRELREVGKFADVKQSSRSAVLDNLLCCRHLEKRVFPFPLTPPN